MTKKHNSYKHDIIKNNIKFIEEEFRERVLYIKLAQWYVAVSVGGLVGYFVLYTTITLLTGFFLMMCLSFMIGFLLILYNHLNTEKENIEEFKILYSMFKSGQDRSKNAKTKPRRGRPRKVKAR